MKQNFTNAFIIILMLSFFFVTTCQSFMTSVDEKNQDVNEKSHCEQVEHDYPPNSGMITDPQKKEFVIQTKIKALEKANQLFWEDTPANKKAIIRGFRNTWNYIKKNFPGFYGITKTKDNPNGINWNKFIKDGLDEIETTNNYGVFVRLITQMGYLLQEGHTKIYTKRMVGSNKLKIFDRSATVINTFPINRIGACCTVTEDEEVVVTGQINNKQNPYNLQVGDEIVGFNGVAWNEWYPRLIESEIPVYGSPASSSGAKRYKLLKSAISNVNLFETINIKRAHTGKIETMEVVYLPFPKDDYNLCLEYIGGVPGVDTPLVSSNKNKGDVMTSGIITDENIGYIYITLCPSGFEDFDDLSEWDPYKTMFSKHFASEIDKLKDTDGIIIDLRYNIGGRNETFYEGLAKLIDAKKDIDLFVTLRKNPNNPDLFGLRLLKSVKEPPIKADNESYNKPIVVLTGPDCMSACDFLVALFNYFENFTIIGTHNNGSFTGIKHSQYEIDNDVIHKSIPLEVGAYVKQHIDYNGPSLEDIENIDDVKKKNSSLQHYLDQHFELLLRRSDFIDEFVWHTKESVINGVDRVRMRAMEIIKSHK